jgi:hypothetical protein
MEMRPRNFTSSRYAAYIPFLSHIMRNRSAFYVFLVDSYESGSLSNVRDIEQLESYVGKIIFYKIKLTP